MATNLPNVPLILGGHSFFSGMGNDPVPSEAEQQAVVAACLDHGIVWFDTTHQPERVQLGKALKALGRRREAKIIAWNFLQDLSGWQPGEKLDRPIEYKPEHLDQLRRELQTDYIDGLVIHELDPGTPDQRGRMEDLARTWQAKGQIGEMGIWAPGEDAEQRFGRNSSYSFAVRPYSVKSREAAPAFAACKRLGWQNYACSPFVRGWELDKMVEKALKLESGREPETRARLADLMLRFSLFEPSVDKLITAIRRVEWVERNVASAARGPLTPDEHSWLDRVWQTE